VTLPWPPRVRCRQIQDTDLDAVLNLLLKTGFGGTREYWIGALRRLTEHPTPAGFPKYGYVLEIQGVVAGMLLLISSSVPVDGQQRVRCNTSCWYVWPAFRSYGALLVAHALKHKAATYFNISPMAHTFSMLEAQGYTRYCEGRITAVPALMLGSFRVRITPVTESLEPDEDLSAAEITLLLEHADYGCISLIAAIGGRRFPFVFEPMWRRRILRVAYLTYCRSIDDFVRFAGPLGRYLARRGFLVIDIDANGPIAGLIGRYWKTTPKFYRGPDRPRLGDLAYSERVVLALNFPAQVGPPEE
jgi:hypothetical protein